MSTALLRHAAENAAADWRSPRAEVGDAETNIARDRINELRERLRAAIARVEDEERDGVWDGGPPPAQRHQLLADIRSEADRMAEALRSLQDAGVNVPPDERSAALSRLERSRQGLAARAREGWERLGETKEREILRDALAFASSPSESEDEAGSSDEDPAALIPGHLHAAPTPRAPVTRPSRGEPVYGGAVPKDLSHWWSPGGGKAKRASPVSTLDRASPDDLVAAAQVAVKRPPVKWTAESAALGAINGRRTQLAEVGPGASFIGRVVGVSKEPAGSSYGPGSRHANANRLPSTDLTTGPARSFAFDAPRTHAPLPPPPELYGYARDDSAGKEAAAAAGYGEGGGYPLRSLLGRKLDFEADAAPSRAVVARPGAAIDPGQPRQRDLLRMALPPDGADLPVDRQVRAAPRTATAAPPRVGAQRRAPPENRSDGPSPLGWLLRMAVRGASVALLTGLALHVRDAPEMAHVRAGLAAATGTLLAGPRHMHGAVVRAVSKANKSGRHANACGGNDLVTRSARAVKSAGPMGAAAIAAAAAEIAAVAGGRGGIKRPVGTWATNQVDSPSMAPLLSPALQPLPLVLPRAFARERSAAEHSIAYPLPDKAGMTEAEAAYAAQHRTQAMAVAVPTRVARSPVVERLATQTARVAAFNTPLAAPPASLLPQAVPPAHAQTRSAVGGASGLLEGEFPEYVRRPPHVLRGRG